MSWHKDVDKTIGILSALDKLIYEFRKETLLGATSLKQYSKALDTVTGISNVLDKSIKGQITDFWDLASVLGIMEKTTVPLSVAQKALGDAIQTGDKAAYDAAVDFMQMSEAIFAAKQKFREIIPTVFKFEKRIKKLRVAGFTLLPVMFSLQSLLRQYQKFISPVVKMSELWSYYSQDVAWALEDIADVLLESLEPELEASIGFWESLIGLAEALPESAKEMIAGLVLLGEETLKYSSVAADLGVSFYGLTLGMELIAQRIPLMAKGLTFLRANFLSLAVGVLAAVGMFILVSELLNMLPEDLRKPIGALVAIVGFLVAAAVAWLALHGAMAGPFAPIVIPAILAAVGAGIAGLRAAVSMQDLSAPAMIKTPTLAMLHPKEVVSPAGRRGAYVPKPAPVDITVNVEGASSIEEIVERAVRKGWDSASEHYARKLKSREY